jgi:GT2 family glycosyltransferase
MKLSIIILNFNCKAKILSCLAGIKNLKIENGDYEIIVVDNHSTDGSPEMIKFNAPWVKLLQNDQNLGFAKGNNKGLRLAQGRYILFLNPDTEIPQGTIEMMLELMVNNPEVGLVTCRVELSDQRLDPACHRGFPTPWASLCYFLKLERLFPKSKIFGQYHMTWCQLNEPHEIDAPSGCFFLVRRSVLEKVGSFDEDYFLYGEDVDLAYRIKQAGFKILFYPKVKIIHYKGISSGIKANTSKISKAKEDTKNLAINAFHDAMWLFYRKHLQKNYPFFVGWLVYLGIWFKRQSSLLSKRV